MDPEKAPLAACPDCDLLQRVPVLVSGGTADCARCGAELLRCHPRAIDHTLAFLLAAGIVFAFANIFPLMAMDARGLRASATLLGTADTLYRHGEASVAALVLFTAILFPLAELAAMTYILLPLRLGEVPPGLRIAFRIVDAVRPWGMAEVYILGALIAFVKLHDIARVEPGIALYALGGFVMLLAAADAAYEPRAVWKRARELGA